MRVPENRCHDCSEDTFPKVREDLKHLEANPLGRTTCSMDALLSMNENEENVKGREEETVLVLLFVITVTYLRIGAA